MKFRLPTLRPRQPFIGLALAALAGIALGEFVVTSPAVAVAVAGALSLPLWTRWRTTAWCWLFAASAFFALHTLRHHSSVARTLAQEFAGGASVVQARGVVWNEPEKPRVFGRGVTCHFLLKIESLNHGGRERTLSALAQVKWAGPPPRYGDRVSVLGSVSNIPPASNPGQFDFPAYQQRQGVYSEIKAKYPADCRVLEHDRGEWARQLAFHVTDRVRAALALDLGDAPDIASLIQSMVLGVRGEMLDETKLYFQETGTMHLFAVSGLNVAMLIIIAFFLLKPLGVGRKAAFFLLLPTLLLYALITGPSASCLRAGIMGALVLGSYLVDRPAAPYNSLAAAAFLILAWDTEQFFSPGFQFSFVLVLVLLIVASPLQRRMLPWGLPDPFLPRVLWNRPQRFRAWLWNGATANLSVSTAAWAGSAIFTAGYFHLFSPATVGANLIAVPLAFVILALGLASVLTAWLVPGVAVLFNNANWLCAKVLLFVVQGFAQVPGSHVYVEKPHFTARPACEITVLDAGSGASTFLRTRAQEWLLDCGSAFEYQRVVLPFLRSRGVNRLDGLLLTHGDVAHIGAADLALNDLAPRALVDSPVKDRSPTRRRLHAELAARGLGKRLCQRGDVLDLGNGATLRVLFPPAGLERSLADDKAFVLLLESAGARVLFMSDGGFPTEQWLLKNEPGLRADVLVKGQHAKDLSATEDFLATVQPKAIVASRPNLGASTEAQAEWRGMVAARGIALFPQETSGAVTIELRDSEWSARGFVDGQTFRSRAR